LSSGALPVGAEIDSGSVDSVTNVSGSLSAMVLSTVSVGASSSTRVVGLVGDGSGNGWSSGDTAADVSGPITGISAVNPTVAATVTPTRERCAGNRRRPSDRAARRAAMRSSAERSFTSAAVGWARCCFSARS
jgi:hypothetical protein